MNVVLVGAGGHAKAVCEAIAEAGGRIEAYVARQPADWLDAPHIAHDDEAVPGSGTAVLGIGGVTPDQLDKRLGLLDAYLERGFGAAPVVHHAAHVSPSAELAPGAVVLAGAVVQPDARISRGVIVNSGALVEHDSAVGAGSHVAPGAIILGDCTVGDCCMIGGRRRRAAGLLGAGPHLGARRLALRDCMTMFASGQRPYVIAEIGANHNGDMDLARKMIDAAKACGADAAKFQSWDTSLFSKEVYDQNHFLDDDYRDRDDYTLKEIVDAFAVTPDQMVELRDYCGTVGIDFSSTPFSTAQLDQLVALGAPYIKIASMDLNNPRLLRAAGRTSLPVLLSTGFGSLAEIERAVQAIEAEGNRDIVILHCVSLYPPEDDEVNLNNIDMLRSVFSYPVGFSDHSIGIEIPLAAMAKGAVVVEKHFTLDKDMFGWDHKASADPAELEAICRGAGRIHAALGRPRRVVGDREQARRPEYRRSIVSARKIEAGAVLTDEDLDFRRPGTGIDPMEVDRILGMTAARDIAEDTVIRFDDLRGEPG